MCRFDEKGSGVDLTNHVTQTWLLHPSSLKTMKGRTGDFTEHTTSEKLTLPRSSVILLITRLGVLCSPDCVRTFSRRVEGNRIIRSLFTPTKKKTASSITLIRTVSVRRTQRLCVYKQKLEHFQYWRITPLWYKVYKTLPTFQNHFYQTWLNFKDTTIKKLLTTVPIQKILPRCFRTFIGDGWSITTRDRNQRISKRGHHRFKEAPQKGLVFWLKERRWRI